MLHGKVALITGSAPGIGAGIARVMAQGARVARLDLDRREAEEDRGRPCRAGNDGIAVLQPREQDQLSQASTVPQRGRSGLVCAQPSNSALQRTAGSRCSPCGRRVLAFASA